MIESDFSVDIFQGFRAGHILNLGGSVQDGQDSFGAGHGLLHALQQVGKAGDRRIEQAEIQQEGDDIRNAQPFPVGQKTAETHHQDRSEGGNELHRGMKNRADLQGLKHGTDVREILNVHLLRFIFFPAEGLDLVNAGEIVLKLSVQFTHFLLGNPEKWPDLFGKENAGGKDQGKRSAGDQRQFPVDGQQHDEDAQEGDQVCDGFGNHMGIEQFEIPGVVHNPAHQVTGLLVVKIAQVHMLQLVISPGSQIADQIPGSLVGQIIAEKPEENAQQIQPDQRHSEQADGMQAGLIHAGFHNARHGGEELRRGQVHRRQQERGQDGDGIKGSVSDGFTAEPPQCLHHLFHSSVPAHYKH